MILDTVPRDRIVVGAESSLSFGRRAVTIVAMLLTENASTIGRHREERNNVQGPIVLANIAYMQSCSEGGGSTLLYRCISYTQKPDISLVKHLAMFQAWKHMRISEVG